MTKTILATMFRLIPRDGKLPLHSTSPRIATGKLPTKICRSSWSNMLTTGSMSGRA